jgi:hypothetical protein
VGACAYVRVCVPECVCVYVQARASACVPTCMPACVRVLLCVLVRVSVCSGVCAYAFSSVRVCLNLIVYEREFAGAGLCACQYFLGFVLGLFCLLKCVRIFVCL